MPFEPDHLLLNRYCDARDDGEPELARARWEQLAVNNFDRIKQIVKAFRFSPGGPRLPDHEWGSAASEAYLRVISMGASFRHREVGASTRRFSRAAELLQGLRAQGATPRHARRGQHRQHVRS